MDKHFSAEGEYGREQLPLPPGFRTHYENLINILYLVHDVEGLAETVLMRPYYPDYNIVNDRDNDLSFTQHPLTMVVLYDAVNYFVDLHKNREGDGGSTGITWKWKEDFKVLDQDLRNQIESAIAQALLLLSPFDQELAHARDLMYTSLIQPMTPATTEEFIVRLKKAGLTDVPFEQIRMGLGGISHEEYLLLLEKINREEGGGQK